MRRCGRTCRLAGTPVDARDLWFAATRITHVLMMVTANARELERVPGLQVETWSGAG